MILPGIFLLTRFIFWIAGKHCFAIYSLRFCSVGIQIRIRMLLGLLDSDPDPFVRGTDPDPVPDPDPSHF
jgi:hypothetical protein